MRRECAESETSEWCEAPYGPHSGASRRNEHLSDYFGAYQGFWTRQSTYWYDVIGRFVCGEYRVADTSKDIARFWDDWMADYQRGLQFPHRKAQAGQVPNVVFVLDELAQGSRPKEVSLGSRLGGSAPNLVATPLLAVGVGAGAAFIRAAIDERGYYAKLELINAATIPRGEAHYISVVHTDSASRQPVAVVHVVRRAASERAAQNGRDEGRGPGAPAGGGVAADGVAGPGPAAARVQVANVPQAYDPAVAGRPAASIELAEALVEKKNEHEERITNLEESVSLRARYVDARLDEAMAQNREMLQRLDALREAVNRLAGDKPAGYGEAPDDG